MNDKDFISICSLFRHYLDMDFATRWHVKDGNKLIMLMIPTSHDDFASAKEIKVRH